MKTTLCEHKTGIMHAIPVFAGMSVQTGIADQDMCNRKGISYNTKIIQYTTVIIPKSIQQDSYS